MASLQTNGSANTDHHPWPTYGSFIIDYFTFQALSGPSFVAYIRIYVAYIRIYVAYLGRTYKLWVVYVYKLIRRLRIYVYKLIRTSKLSLKVGG